MAVDPTVLETLRCPAAKVPLVVMTGTEVDRLNEAIAQGRAAHPGGAPVTEPLTAGLAAADGSSAYRVDRGVPILLPETRIVSSSPGPRPAAVGAAADAVEATWDGWARAWHLVVPPARPAPEDVATFERIVKERCPAPAGRPTRALLLGVTPEIATMRWPEATRLLALDLSEAMIRHVWPRDGARNATVARANWREMPLRDATYDVVIGDGITVFQSFPDQVRSLASEVGRVLSRSGAWVMRLFAKPRADDALGNVVDDLRRGRIANSMALHFRVAMSLQPDARTGVRCGDIWEAWHASVPDERELFTSLGWPPETIGTFETYRGSDVRLVYPKVDELSDALADAFVLADCRGPAEDRLGMYPTVVFRPRR